MSTLQDITTRLIELREQDESLDLAKAELLTRVIDDKLYKETHKTFEGYAQVIGYHRVYCYDLRRVWKCEPVREAYSDLGAARAIRIAKANLPEQETRELVDFGKAHTDKELLGKIKEVKNKGKPKPSKAEQVIALLKTKERLETQLEQVIAEIEALEPGRVKPKEQDKAKANKTTRKPATRRRSTRPPVTTLGHVYGILNPFVAKRSALAILECLKAEGNTFQATDLESYAILEVESGQDLTPCAFPVKGLTGMKSMSLKDSVFVVTESRLDVTEGATLSIPLDKVEEYPLEPTTGTVEFETDYAGLVLEQEAWQALVRTAQAASPDLDRPILTVVYLHDKQGQLTAVAADGFVLAINPLGIESGETFKGLGANIPAEALVKIDKAVKKIKAESVTLSLIHTHGLIVFEAEGVGARLKVYTRLVEGKFPDYDQINPKKAEKTLTVEVDKGELANLAKQALDVGKQDYAPTEIITRFTFNGTVKAEAQQDMGTWEIPTLASEGEEVEIAFNPKRLGDLLGTLPEGSVTIGLTNATSPAHLQTRDAEAVIMPMHLNR